MKKVFIFLLVVLLVPAVLGLNIDVKKTSSDEVMIKEFQNPVSFDLELINHGDADNLYFYNLVGFQMIPESKIPIGEDENKTIKLTIVPIGEINTEGLYSFSYFIEGKDGEDLKKTLTFRIVSLRDVFDIGSENLFVGEETLKVYIQNKVNVEIEDIKAEFNSAFFESEKSFSLDSYEKKFVSIDLNKEEIEKLTAGFYTLEAKFNINNKTIFEEGVIEFSEKDTLVENEKEYGFLIHTKVLKKENKGNTLVETNTFVRKNIFSRLFTSFNQEPDVVQRQGMEVVYIWDKELSPGEELEVVVKTNWTLPFIFVLIVILTIVFVKKYLKRDVDLKKRVSFVKTKGGEFALKVTLIVSANAYVEKVNIVDKLPPLVKIYDKFTKEKPSKINEKEKRIEWDFSHLEAGEKRVISYVVYSKVGVLGKFALPCATAIFEKEGNIRESSSNRAFFVSEQSASVEE